MNYSQLSDHYDSISRKFDDDFDEDFDDHGLLSGSQNDEEQKQPVQYAMIVPVRERLPVQGILTVYSLKGQILFMDYYSTFTFDLLNAL